MAINLKRETMYDRAWKSLCDCVPATDDAEFNVRYVLAQCGYPTGSLDRLIHRFETQEGHRIYRLRDRTQPMWKWDFSETD